MQEESSFLICVSVQFSAGVQHFSVHECLFLGVQ